MFLSALLTCLVFSQGWCYDYTLIRIILWIRTKYTRVSLDEWYENISMKTKYEIKTNPLTNKQFKTMQI